MCVEFFLENMWKYSLIKIDYPDLWEWDGDYCELVEVYQNSQGRFTSFNEVRIHSFEELEKAYNDAKRDGVNTWFSDNGVFTWDKKDKCWSWKKKDE